MTQYVRQEKIGQGAWSTVYKGLDRMSGQVVAIKELVVEAGAPVREVALGRRITHKNVCPIYHCFPAEDGRSYCIVMEYVDGGSLRGLVEKWKPLPVKKSLSIAGQILDGLEAAHEQGVVHRDLKPANILLTSGGTVKITDFGLAREITNDEQRTQSAAAGTPDYWSPEQALGRKCDARSDIFSFGKILERDLFPGDVPPYVAAVIERCTQMNPNQRFNSVAEVRKALGGHSVPRLTPLLAISAVILLLAAVPFWKQSWTDGFKSVQSVKSAPDSFSDGLYFLRKDMAADALNRFDAALARDPANTDAYHYRGVALAKLNRLDEAIDAFKRALPRTEPQELVLWDWAPSLAPEHGIIRGMDTTQQHVQRYLFEKGKGETLPKQVVYGERANGGTVLYFLDLEGHVVRRREIRDPQIVLDGAAPANESFLVLRSAQSLYGFARDGTELWHKEFSNGGPDVRRIGLSGNTVFIYWTDSMRIDLLDTRTGDLLWKRENMPFDGIEAPIARHTNAFGDIFIIKSENAYHALRQSDGSDAWTVSVQSTKVSELVDDSSLIVFEPERRIFTVDLETGNTTSELKLEQYADTLSTPFGPKWLVGAIVDGNTLYVMSKDLQLYAIHASPSGRGRCEAAGEGRKSDPIVRPSPSFEASPCRARASRPLPKGEGQIVWRTPIDKRMQSIRAHGKHLYLGTDTGELIVMDAATGKTTSTTKFSEQPVVIDYTGDDAVVVASNDKVYGLNADGVKKWESPSGDSRMETTYFNGIMTVYNSPVQMSALDVATGKRLWQVDGTRPPLVYTNAGRFFVLEEHGAKEYAIRKPPGSITDKETLTELAKAYQAKGDLEQARVFTDKASEIDPNYAPVSLVRSQLLKALGNMNEAGRELARYASLIGLDSAAGQRTVSELKREYGLVWETSIGAYVAGDPVLLENRLISVGRSISREAPIIALDAQTGAAVWRYTGETYVASVLADHLLWYVTGSEADPPQVTVYRIDPITGERKQIASWRRSAGVDQGWIAYAAGRLFVATQSVDVDKSIMQLVVDCFDAGSGARISQKSDVRKANMSERQRPLGILASLGFPSVDSPPPAKSPSSALWNTSSFLSQNNRLYAFTDDGRAYARQLIPYSEGEGVAGQEISLEGSNRPGR